MSEQLTVESILANLHNFKGIADLIERDPDRALVILAGGSFNLSLEQLLAFVEQMKGLQNVDGPAVSPP